jgi:predicted phage baseplate assembly protein
MSNRPGLPGIVHRSTGHAASLAAMRARLAAPDLPALHALRTRAPDDPSMALLDAWASTAEVLGFYEERIANENYLRTATELRSLVELGRLTGTAPRLALPATAWLSYGVINDAAVEIPATSAVQAMPDDGSTPPLFETTAPLHARAGWSRLAVRQTMPQTIDAATDTVWLKGAALSLKSNDLLLLVPQAGDPWLVRIATVTPLPAEDRTRLVLQNAAPPPPGDATWQPPFEAARALVEPLARPPAQHPANPQRLPRTAETAFRPEDDTAFRLLTALHPAAANTLRIAVARCPTAPPQPVQVLAFRTRAAVFGNAAPRRLVLSPTGTLTGTEEWSLNPAEALPGEPLAVTLHENDGVLEARIRIGRFPLLAMEATRNQPATRRSYDEAHDEVELTYGDATAELRFRRRAAGISLAALRDAPQLEQSGEDLGPVTLAVSGVRGERLITLTGSFAVRGPTRFTEHPRSVSLDTTYDGVVPGTWVVVDRPQGDRQVPRIAKIAAGGVRSLSRAEYGITGRVTELTLDQDWISPADSFAVIRGTTIHAGTEALALAEHPIESPVEGDRIDLATLEEGLTPGRWLVVEGERNDDVPGIPAAEVVMLAAVEQVADPKNPGEATHSRLNVSGPLAYRYRRDSVVVHGNVVAAIHGGTRVEALGSGDAGLAFQRFTLRQGAASGAGGVAGGGAEPLTSLAITANGLPWMEVPSLADAGPDDRVFTVRTDAAAGTTIISFGDGITGARLPTGQENIRAEYRSGAGPAGNLAAGKLTLLVSRPLNVDRVTNPLPSTGGAPPESPQDARIRIPLGLASLDRLVSVADHADLARCFAGVAKVSAVALQRRNGPLVHLTFAATAGALPPPGMAAALLAELKRRGDPALGVAVAPCRLKLVVLAAGLALQPGAVWETVRPAVRATLLDRFGFAQREIAEPLPRSAVIAAIQAVRGVAWLRLTRLTFITPEFDAAALQALATAGVQDITAAPARTLPGSAAILPAEIAFLTASVADLILLEELPA